MSEQQKLVASALRRYESIQRSLAFDPVVANSVATPAQQMVIDDFGTIPVQYIVAGNQSGKSQTAVRLLTWALTDTHPTWKRPAEWGTESLLCIVASRTGKQIEESLLPKIRACLPTGTYKEIRIGNMTQRLELDNGNRIVFQSLENANVAKERLQSYVAHLALVDEMPPTVGILDELLRRLQARGGYFIAAFTPLVENIQIQRMVDASCLPYSKKYQFSMLDNPLYLDPNKRAKILAELSLLPESLRNTRLYGTWSASDSSVYYFDYNTMCREVPSTYRTSWKHVVSVDPALKSALGLTVWAEEPLLGHWYLVHSEEISGIYDPVQMEDTVYRKTLQYNVIRRISDPHEVWYMQLASRAGRYHMGVYSKNNRKGELIKQLQSMLGSRVFIPPHNVDFIDQILGCKWADSDKERIIAASSKHLLDSAQYFCDNIPKHEKTVEVTGWDQQLYLSNEKRKQQEHRKTSAMTTRRRVHRGGRR